MTRLPLLALLLATALSATLTEPQQARFDELADGFVAPCCGQEALSAHRSPAAEQARAELTAMIEAGRSDAEIREAFVEQYGKRVLIVPEGGQADLLFWTPWIALALGGAWAAWFLLRLRRRAAVRPAADGPLAEIDESEIDW
ncbi:MAG: hypothetical protein GC160_08495 [Acidobacteria bacterium]|nr:hypothetical protein [Acidobacteriota bacterium]